MSDYLTVGDLMHELSKYNKNLPVIINGVSLKRFIDIHYDLALPSVLINTYLNQIKE